MRFAAVLALFLCTLVSAHAAERPKLTLVLVIDQFRADTLLRFEKRFLPARGKGGEVGGFNYLMTQGAYYPMAEYGISQSMTCPGHATILTGSYPYTAGIPVNGWYNPTKHAQEYCAEDTRYPIVGPTDRPNIGRAPTLLNGTTLGDELKNAGLGSRVIALALKDRSAIMMGGHRADLAFWMSSNFAWESSTFYLPEKKLPEWLARLNQEIQPQAEQMLRWEVKGPGSGLSDPNYRPARETSRLGVTFPHEIKGSSYGALALPVGLELTEQAAERAIDAYKLGQGSTPDLLAVSFSSHDYIGHAFGPNSREIEEMTVAEDKLLSKLFNHIRKKVPGGLANVVIALTGDHGSPPDPEWAHSHRIDAGMISEKKMSEALEKAMAERYGRPPDNESWIVRNHDLNVFVNRRALAAKKNDLGEALALVKARLLASPGIAHAFTALDVEQGRLPPGLLGEQAKQTYYPGRSGDIVALAKPYWMVEDADAVTHLTGYSYDRMVPLVIVGPGVKPARYPAHARVIDLAPTLSYLLGVLPPALSEGRVLSEALSPSGAKSK